MAALITSKALIATFSKEITVQDVSLCCVPDDLWYGDLLASSDGFQIFVELAWKNRGRTQSRITFGRWACNVFRRRTNLNTFEPDNAPRYTKVVHYSSYRRSYPHPPRKAIRRGMSRIAAALLYASVSSLTLAISRLHVKKDRSLHQHHQPDQPKMVAAQTI